MAKPPIPRDSGCGIPDKWREVLRELPPEETRDLIQDQLAARRSRRELVAKVTSDVMSKVGLAMAGGALWAFVDQFRKWIGK